MSGKIALYTPDTGFPDLEIKIAYGLIRVGIEAGAEVSLTPYDGLYQITFSSTTENTKIDKAFNLLLKRILTSQKFYDIGVKARYKKNYIPSKETINRLSQITLRELYKFKLRVNFDFTKDRQCGHKGAKFGATKLNERELGGLILLTSVHAGKPQYRDQRKRDLNLGLCETCGYLSVLGKESFCFTIQLGKGKNRKFVIVTPMPNRTLKMKELSHLLSIQKTLHNFWLSDLIPLNVFTLGLLAKIPSLSDIVRDLQINLHLVLLSKDNRGDTVVEQVSIVNASPFGNFITSSAYNSATIYKLIEREPKISALQEINSIIKKPEPFKLLKFARLYVQETSTNNWTNLLYPETTNYLLKEVAMVKTKIIENSSIRSVARMLRYFIRERKYGYADDIRNARKDSKDFEETIAKMLREAELRRVQQEQDKKQNKEIKNIVYIPNEDEIKELFKLANEDFEGTKIALVMLAFSFPTKKEKTEEITS